MIKQHNFKELRSSSLTLLVPVDVAVDNANIPTYSPT